MKLDPEERASLIRLRIKSVNAESEEGVEGVWRVEIERRMAKVDSGTVKTMPWEELSTTVPTLNAFSRHQVSSCRQAGG